MVMIGLIIISVLVLCSLLVVGSFVRDVFCSREEQKLNYVLSLNEDERRKYYQQEWELGEKRRRAFVIAALAIILAAIGLFLGIWAFNLSL